MPRPRGLRTKGTTANGQCYEFEIQSNETMKYLKTNLEGKVRHLPHFKSEALLPVFEAVVNSIQAIEESGNLQSGEIEVRIVREAQTTFGDIEIPAIADFLITDNGIGFLDWEPGDFD